MGIDAKSIRVCLWRFLKFSMTTFYRCARKHPFVSGILLFYFILYVRYPSAFLVVIYASPVLVCTLVFLRIYLGRRHPLTLNVKKEDDRHLVIPPKDTGLVEGEGVVNKNEKAHLQTQRSRRRNFRDKNIELDDSISRTTLTEATPKEPQNEKANSSSLDGAESSSLHAYNAEKVDTLDPDPDPDPSKVDIIQGDCSYEWSDKSNGAGGGELEGDSQDDPEDEEDRNKAVEWTEDDEKNLMDLGTSEIERNKRLESLIAKRKARKLLRMQVEKNLIDLDGDTLSQIAPILIAKINPFGLPTNPDESEGLMPGSAPSVLLPMRNPFDLPYDPLEEKPNLSGDSFHQEFMSVNQKDMFFCRHESFSLGPSFPRESNQDRHDTKFSPLFTTERKTSDGPGISRFKRQSDMSDNEDIAEQALASEGEPLTHVESVPDHVKQGGQPHEQELNRKEIRLEEDKKLGSRMIKGNLEKKKNTHDNGGPSSSSPSTSSSSSSNCSENLQPTMGNFPDVLRNSFQRSLTCSVPRNIAISENNCQTNDPCYDSSPSPTATDKTRLEEHLFYESKRANLTPTYSIASDLQVEISEVGSPPLTADGTISPPDGESLTYDGDVEKDITSGSEDMWGESSHLPGVEENESRSSEVCETTEDAIVEVGFSAVSQNFESPKSSSTSQRAELPSESQPQVVGLNHKTHDVVQQVGQEEIEDYISSNSSEGFSHENLALGVPEHAQKLKEKVDAGNSGSGKLKEPSNSTDKSTGMVNIKNNVKDPVVQANDDKCLQSIKDKECEAHLLINHEANKDLLKAADGASSSKSIENKENLELTRANEREQITIEVGVSRSSGIPIASATQPEVVIEQVPVASSASSSPKSVLPENVPSLNFLQMLHVDVPVVDNSSLHEGPPENRTLTMPPNAQQLTFEAAFLPSNYNSGFEKLKEPSISPGNSTKETSNDSKGESQSVTRQEAVVEPSKLSKESEPQLLLKQEATVEPSTPSEETSSRSMDDVKGKSRKLMEDEATIGTSKSEEKNVNSSTNKPTEFEGVIQLPKPAEAKDDLKANNSSEGESMKLIRNEAVVVPSKADELKCSSNIPVTVVEKEVSNPSSGESGKKCNITHDVNESVCEMDKNEILISVGDGEGQSQKPKREDDGVDKLINLKSTKEADSEKLIGDKMMAATSKPEEKTCNASTTEDVREPRMSIEHKDAIDSSKIPERKVKASEDVKGKSSDLIYNHTVNKSLDQRIITEPSNSIDSKVEVAKPEITTATPSKKVDSNVDSNPDMNNGYKEETPSKSMESKAEVLNPDMNNGSTEVTPSRTMDSKVGAFKPDLNIGSREVTPSKPNDSKVEVPKPDMNNGSKEVMTSKPLDSKDEVPKPGTNSGSKEVTPSSPMDSKVEVPKSDMNNGSKEVLASKPMDSKVEVLDLDMNNGSKEMSPSKPVDSKVEVLKKDLNNGSKEMMPSKLIDSKVEVSKPDMNNVSKEVTPSELNKGSESQLLNMEDAVVEPSKQSGETSTSKSIQDSKEESRQLIEDEAIIGPSKSIEKNVSSSTIKDSDAKSSKESEGELNKSIDNAAAANSSKPSDERILVPVIEGKEVSNPSSGESGKKCNITNDVNESVREMDKNEILISVGDGEVQSQRPKREDDGMDKLTNLKSTKETESEKLIGDKIMAAPSKPEWKTCNASTTDDVKESRLSIEHKDAIDSSKIPEGKVKASEDVKGKSSDLIYNNTVNKSLDQRIITEPSNSIDSKVEAAKPDISKGTPSKQVDSNVDSKPDVKIGYKEATPSKSIESKVEVLNSGMNNDSKEVTPSRPMDSKVEALKPDINIGSREVTPSKPNDSKVEAPKPDMNSGSKEVTPSKSLDSKVEVPKPGTNSGSMEVTPSSPMDSKVEVPNPYMNNGSKEVSASKPMDSKVEVLKLDMNKEMSASKPVDSKVEVLKTDMNNGPKEMTPSKLVDSKVEVSKPNMNNVSKEVTPSELNKGSESSQLQNMEDAVVEPSKQSGDTSTSKSMQDYKGESTQLIEDEAIIGPSKSIDKNMSSSTITDSDVKASKESEGELNKSTDNAAASNSPKPSDERIPVPVIEGKEPSIPAEKSTKEASKEKGEVNPRSIEDGKSDSQLLIRQEAVVEPTILSTKGPSKLIEDKAIAATSISKEKNANSFHDQGIIDLPKPVESEDRFKAGKESESESKKLNKTEAMVDSSKPVEESCSLNIPIKVVEGKEISDPSLGESAKKCDITQNVNKSLLQEVDSKESSKPTRDRKGESKRPSQEEAKFWCCQEDGWLSFPGQIPPNAIVKDIHDHHGRLLVLQTPAEEITGAPNTIKDNKECRLSVDHKDAIEPLKPGEDKGQLRTAEEVKGKSSDLMDKNTEVDKSLNHRIVTESTKPTGL